MINSTKSDRILPIMAGKRIILEKLTPDHVKRLTEWGSHENTLFGDYNLSEMDRLSRDIWYKLRKESIRNKYFAIISNSDEFIGYLGIKDINIFRKTALLGIVLDPDKTDMGYGTEALELLLKYYFEQLNMKTMFLEVNEFNKRAYRVYEKFGFVPEGEFLGEFEVDIDTENDPYYHANSEYFVVTNGKLYSRIIRMRLDKVRALRILNRQRIEMVDDPHDVNQ